MIENKKWGQKEVLHKQNNLVVDRLCIKKGGYCSRHKHIAKYNKFYVESGQLKIILELKEGDKEIIIGDACEYRMFIIAQNRVHQFVALTDVLCYEISYVNLEQSDIIRYTEGGVLDDMSS